VSEGKATSRGILAPGGGLWYLEGFVDDSRQLRRVPIITLPFRIGRHPDQDLTLDSSAVSGRHAELRAATGELLEIADLGSTNGTLLNGEPLSGIGPLQEGDIVQLATLEFRLGILGPSRTEALLGSTTEIGSPLPALLVERTVRFRELLEQEAVAAHVQPIVALSDRRPIGHEVLGRSRLPSLPLGSWELFEIASVVGAEAKLSRLFRRHGAVDCGRMPAELVYFFNTHPAELREEGLLESLERLRGDHPALRLVLEIHEATITQPASMARLQTGLRELGIGLAYDDFGAGQTRLAELAAAPPDFLKFDRRMIEDIDSDPGSRSQLLTALVKMADELGIRSIAEGIESQAEAETCAELGFQLGQGFLFGVPAPAPAKDLGGHS
jgi:EAL domain-containing protein (putative c-di-GMP-specific phosphodiesterase class I)